MTSPAAADTAAPVIVSHEVTATTLDVISSEASVDLSVRLTDEIAMASYSARIRHAATGQYHFLSAAYLATGTVLNGVWRSTATLPQGRPRELGL